MQSVKPPSLQIGLPLNVSQFSQSLRLPKVQLSMAQTERLPGQPRTRLRALVETHMRIGYMASGSRTSLMLSPVSSEASDKFLVKDSTARSLPALPVHQRAVQVHQTRKGEIGLVKGGRDTSAFMMLASKGNYATLTAKHSWFGGVKKRRAPWVYGGIDEDPGAWIYSDGSKIRKF